MVPSLRRPAAGTVSPMIRELFRPKAGRRFIPWAEARAGVLVSVMIGREGGGGGAWDWKRPEKGLIGTLPFGPKDWTPRPEPSGFEPWFEILPGDQVFIRVGNSYFSSRRPSSARTRLGLLRRGSPLFKLLAIKPALLTRTM